jgi:hypothetical protein
VTLHFLLLLGAVDETQFFGILAQQFGCEAGLTTFAKAVSFDSAQDAASVSRGAWSAVASAKAERPALPNRFVLDRFVRIARSGMGDHPASR